MTSAFLRTFLWAGVLLATGGGAVLAQTHAPPSGTAAEALAAFAWDATWIGGWEGGEGTQVVIAGGEVVGFFWGGDYLNIETSTNLADGGPIKFIYPGGEGLLKEGGEGELLIKIHEEGKEDIGFVLKRG
jgi:hypothetical protein